MRSGALPRPASEACNVKRSRGKPFPTRPVQTTSEQGDFCHLLATSQLLDASANMLGPESATTSRPHAGSQGVSR